MCVAWEGLLGLRKQGCPPPAPSPGNPTLTMNDLLCSTPWGAGWRGMIYFVPPPGEQGVVE